MRLSQKTLLALAAAACIAGFAASPAAQAAAAAEKTVTVGLFWLDADIDPKNG